jgi:selenocysteine lyase/cysteine desulfurase
LFVQRDKIGGLWPLHACDELLDGDIRKFEQLGTHPIANFLAIAEALALHETIGAKRKLARLRYLRDLFATRLGRNERVCLRTSLSPAHSIGVATLAIEGIDSKALAAHLWDAHQILVAAIVHPDVQGIRVSPHVYTRVADVERFCEVVEDVLRRGLPG